MRRSVLVWLVLLVAPGVAGGRAAAAPADSGAWQSAATPWRFEFPRDHAAHPGFRTEWWYYTGSLESGKRRFGFEWTMFRVGIRRDRPGGSAWEMRDLLFAHAALTDENGRRFLFADTLVRPVMGLAGADSARYHVWIEDWSAERSPDGRTHRVRADAGRFALALELDASAPPVVHGERGVSRKSDDPATSSHYYSIPCMPATGTVTLDGRRLAVTGEAWMDHEFMSAPIDSSQQGWDWFGLRFEDGSALMLYRLRGRDGSIDSHSSGTWVAPDGHVSHLPLASAGVTATRTWTSRASGATYPARWSVSVPGETLTVEVEPTVADQELRTRGPVAVTYWEGSVRVRGTRRGRPVVGVGYVEMTGYTGPPPGR